ncbi:cobalamin adenosyltransferase [Oceanirhabdus sp. W0125-5]|uniref:cobalamin adenosyltransferase n=1 Tax=Oceanirhabdus sp. W0125-5 TaxID=2999116 RepID=UPI0022F2C87F|nr:cobalamin adenosyltransferase [Oceanirhabdus sp. W0125-5]WBW94910.1 cobalamin adenosyltransferase [Oceanirhabdus sp. W0125-5]
MSVLTESKLRMELKKKDIREFKINKKDIVTPSARAFLSEKNIKLIIMDEVVKEGDEPQNTTKENNEDRSIIPKYERVEGGFFQSKPEFMTHLYGNKLVYKDHPTIVLRGKLDSFQAKLLETQILAHKNKKIALVKDLDGVLATVRGILRAEVLGEELKEFNLLNMKEDEIRDISHHPEKYFNKEHVFPNYEMGEIALCLNSLRTGIREVEIYALKAFKDRDGEVKRKDIMMCLNRLSSCFYVMMLKLNAGQY